MLVGDVSDHDGDNDSADPRDNKACDPSEEGHDDGMSLNVGDDGGARHDDACGML